MTSADKQLLRSAAELHGRLVRAATVARGNGLGYLIFGGLTLLLASSGPDVLGLLVGALVTGVGVAQRRLAPRLRRADPEAPRALARNELVLMGGTLVYCLLQLTVLRPSDAELQAQLRGMGPLGVDIGELTDTFTKLVYFSFMLVTLLYQGGLALYFLRRRPMAERYLAETPSWARETLESLRD